MATKIVHMKIKGLRELNININRLRKQVSSETITRELLKDGELLRADIVKRLYIRWGRKAGAAGRSFIVKLGKRRRKDAISVIVASDKKLLPPKKSGKPQAPYPKYLEWGTSKLMAGPYFRPALRAYRKLVKTEGALKRLIERAGMR